MKEQYVYDYERLEKEHWWWLARRRILRSSLKRVHRGVTYPQKPSLLDLGCGAGVNLSALRDDFDCVGMEPNRTLSIRARANAKVPIYQGSLPYGIPDLGQAFDYILLLDVLEHIEDDLAALKAAASLLTKNGKIIINVPAMHCLWSVHDEINLHKRRYSAGQLKRLVHRSGLRLRSLRHWGSFLVPLVYVERHIMAAQSTKERYRVKIPPRMPNRILEELVIAEFAWLGAISIPFGLSMLAIMQHMS